MLLDEYSTPTQFIGYGLTSLHIQIRDSDDDVFRN